MFDQITAPKAAAPAPTPAPRPSGPVVPSGSPYLGAPPDPNDTLDLGAIARATFQNAKNLVGAMAPAMQDEGTLAANALQGKPNPLPTREQIGQMGQAAETPLLPISAGAKPGTLTHGVSSALEGLTTPENLGIIAVTGPLNTAANAARVGWQAAGLKTINAALHAYFTEQMLKGAGQNLGQAVSDWQDGDMGAVADHLGAATVNAILGYFGIQHGYEQLKDIGKVKIPISPKPAEPAANGPYNREPQAIAPVQQQLPGETGQTGDQAPEPTPPPTNPPQNPPAPAPAPPKSNRPAPREADALEFARQNPDAKATDLQRQFHLGYGAAKRILDSVRTPPPVTAPAPEAPPAPAPAPDVFDQIKPEEPALPAQSESNAPAEPAPAPEETKPDETRPNETKQDETAPEPPKWATENAEIIEAAKAKEIVVAENPEDGTTGVVSQHTGGKFAGHWFGGLRDNSADEMVGGKIFPTREAAEAYARSLVEGRNPEAPAPAPAPPAPDVFDQVAEEPKPAEIPNLPHPKMPAFVDELEKRLESGPAIKDTPALVKLAGEVLGDKLTSGKYDVKDLYDALETAVNRFISRDGSIMQAEPAKAIEGLEHFVASLPTQTARTTEQKQFQQFSTPPTLSYVAAKAAAIRPGETVLEPSAGTGSLAAFAKSAGAHVETNELSPSRAAFLELQGYKPTSVNAERIRDHRPDLKPDVVLMNPPFSATAGRKSQNSNNVGFQHVLSALDTLPEGGRLVAILGRGASFDHVTALPFWKKIQERGASVRANIGLDGSNYAKYGTTFDNRLIIIDKTPNAGKPVTGEFKDLREAYGALQPVIDDRRTARPGDSAPGGEVPLGSSSERSGEGDRGQLPEGESGDGVSGSGRGRPGQSDVHVEPRRPRNDAATAPKPELQSGPADAVSPAPTGDTGADRPSERQQPLVELKTRERSVEAAEQQGAYQQYKPAKLATGVSHEKATGTGLVETGAMASVEPPDIGYTPHLPKTVIDNGHITDAQLEAITYAGQANSIVAPNGRRMGFMIGDGTGVGKGTEAAGIALDNWNQGRRKILWLSLKPGLIKQAQRDLDWVEAPIKAKLLNDWGFGEPIDHEGVVFGTYAMLHRVSANQNEGSRLDQIVKWQPDVILMDESHAAKNAVVAGGDDDEGSGGRVRLNGTTSKAGEAVLDLDKQLPDARVTYFSATAFTDVSNLGYANRLGLWGPGTSFPAGFREFMVEIDRGGYGAMELVSKEMKALGRYIARQISFDGVEYREVTAHLTAAQREMYNAGVAAWQQIFKRIDDAIAALAGEDDTRSQGLARGRALSQFWAANQRFYRNLITAMKIPTVIQEIETALEKGNSVFLDLVSTGEAEAQRQLVKAAEQDLSFDELDMSAKAIIKNFLDAAFPTAMMEDYEDEEGRTRSRPVLDEQGKPVHSQEALAMKEALLRDLDKIQLPQSPLDQILDYFGPDQVAEVSGRKSRIVQDQKTGKPVEVQRVKPKGATAKDVNDWERQNFQTGKKRIAVASGAGGTGFDFHSDKRTQNQQRRTHIVLEPSWSADQQMQKFGRTHRTNQAVAPEYVLIASDLGGEKRFISAIASRIASLGALTRGERKAGGGAAEMLARYNLEGKYGDAAKAAFFRGLNGGKAVLQDDVTVNLPPIPAELDAMNREDLAGLLGVTYQGGHGQVAIDDSISLKQFLNRMLNLPTDVQKLCFDYFMDLFDTIISTVKDAGAFDEGTQELKALRSRIVNRDVIRRGNNGEQTNHLTIDADFPLDKVTWEQALHHKNQGDISDYNQQQYAGLYRNTRSGNVWMARKAAKDITDQQSGAVIPAMTLIGPKAGSRQTLAAAQLADRDKYERLGSGSDAQKAWEKALADLPEVEKRQIHLINGSVLPVWKQLGGAGDGWKMNVAQIHTENGGTVSGIIIPPEQIEALKQELGGTGDASPSLILNRVWRQGERVTLRGATLSSGRVQGERAIVITPGATASRTVLDRMGIPHIETASSVRYYLPYSDDPTPEVHDATLRKLTEVLEAFPVKTDKQEPDQNYFSGISLGSLSHITGNQKGEPLRDYSTLGAIKSKLIRNLSQVEEASPEVHEAAVRAASSRAQSAALMRSAWPKVLDALGGIKPEDFRRALIESRLLGVQQRWDELADAAEQVDSKDLVDWVLNGPLQVLDSMSEDGDLAQQAASLASNLHDLPKSKWNRNAEKRLRSLVSDAFREAAGHVHHMMTPDEFQAITSEPNFQKALGVYKSKVEKTLAQNHELNEGVFSTALGPLKTYYPLTPIRAEDQAAAITGARRGFKKPVNISNKFTTGLADDYDAGLEAFKEKAEAAIRVNDKAALIQELENAGMLRKLKDGQSAETVFFRGREFRAKVVSVGPARVIVTDDGKVIRKPEQRAAIPEPFFHELKPILEPDHKLPPGILKRIVDVANEATLAGPAEAVIHSHNLLGTLVANTPFLGNDLASKTIGNTPVTKIITAIAKIAAVDPMDERATRDLRDMAKLGLLPERFGQETYSQHFANITGAEKKTPGLQWGPILYGPKGIDVRARLVMYRLALQLGPSSPLEVYKFVNQLGNYTEALQGHLERQLKRTGFSRFVTAGSTMLRNGVDAWLGTGEGAGPGGGKKNRAAQMLSAGAIGMIAAWVTLYYAATGKWPWEDKRAKLFKFPAPDSLRRSKIGLALWGHDLRKVGYINFGFFSPLVSRGARGLGIDDAFNTQRVGGNVKQMAEASKRSVANGLIHPVAGPAARMAIVGVTGKQPYLVGDTDSGGSKMLPAINRKAPIGSEIGAAFKQLNSFYGNVGAATGFAPSEDQKATPSELILKAIIDMTGLSGGASNPNAAQQALAKERRIRK